MTIKKQRVPRSACYLRSATGDDAGGIQFALLSEEDDDEEEDAEGGESASESDDGEEDDGDSEEAAGEGGDSGDDDSDDEEEAGDEKASKQSFSMLAHTGKVMSRWYGNLVLDMDGARYRQKVALIKDHDTSQPLGFSTKITRTERGIEAKGKLLSNAAAAEVAQYSREGFPWQASLMAVPSRIENVEAGQKTEVNGREVLGPVTIFREWAMHELTLTTLGADDDTQTEAFAGGEEIEVEIMPAKTKKDPRRTTQRLSSTGAAPAAVSTVSTGAEERSRVTEILGAADSTQQDLARSLIESGVPLTEALSELNRDLRERFNLARGRLDDGSEPLSNGNSGGVDGTGAAGGAHRFSWDSLPDPDDFRDDPETLSQLSSQAWQQHEELRGEFDNEATFAAWLRHRHECIHAKSNVEVSEKLSGGLKGIGHRNIQGRYWLRYDEKMRGAWVNRIATQVVTDQDHEVYKWLGNLPAPDKWQGERRRRTLTDYGLTVVGEKFEDTVEVDVDDLRRDKLGMIPKRLSELGGKMAALDPRLVTKLLVDNGMAYDGLPLYDQNHVVRNSGIQSNAFAFSVSDPNKPTPEEWGIVLLSMIQNMLEVRDEDGEPINEDATKFFFLFPVKYLTVAQQAMNQEFLANGISNALKSTDFEINFAINGRFSKASTDLFCFREDAEVHALIGQEERIPDAFKTQDAYSEGGFWRDKVAYGGKRIKTYAPGRFELTSRATLQV